MSTLEEAPAPAETGAVPVAPAQRALPYALGALALGVAAYALFFGWFSVSLYRAYAMHALDLGNMGQAAWNTIHGHPFYFTNMRLPYAIEAWRTTTRLSFHVEAIFPIVSLLYAIYPHAQSLLVLQTIALAVGAVPVFLLARDVLRNSWLGVLFAFAYLLYPPLEGLNLYEFHPVALATPLLLFAFFFMRRGQMVPFVACCVAAMGTKEEIGLVVAAFGLYAGLVEHRRRVGFSLAAAGVAWTLIAILVIEHHSRQPGTVTYFRSRYGYLGHGIGGVVHTIVHHPRVFAQVLFTWPKLGYLLRLLAPLGFTPLLAPAALALGAPTLLLNLFSTDYHMYSGLGDNSAELIAVFMIASILGTRTLIRMLEPWLSSRSSSALAAVWIAGLALWNQHQDGFTPIGNAYGIPSYSAHQRVLDRFVSMIPSGDPVSTQDQLDPHLSSRRYLYLFPDTGRVPPLAPANHILLDVTAPTYPLPSYQIHDAAQTWIHRAGWGVVAADDGAILIARGAKSQAMPASFYTYARPGPAGPSHPFVFASHGLTVTGFDRVRADPANNHIPNLLFTFYVRASQPLTQDLEPVVYQVMGKDLISCAAEPLGLAWRPTSQWKPGTRYLVRSDALTTDWQTPGTAGIFLEIRAVPDHRLPPPSCASLWTTHGKLAEIGTNAIQF
jgi:uncharacterized membrane protein